MSFGKTKIGLTVLQWALGAVVLIEAVMFVLPGAAHDFARTHMPGFVRLVLGFGEIAGCILLLIPRSAGRGCWWPCLLWGYSFTCCMACTALEIWSFMTRRPSRSLSGRGIEVPRRDCRAVPGGRPGRLSPHFAFESSLNIFMFVIST